MAKSVIDYSAFKDFPQDGMSRGFVRSIRDIIFAGKYKDEAYKTFAKANNFVYKENEKVNEEGSLFKHGALKWIPVSLEGELNGLPFKIAEYNYKDHNRFGSLYRDVLYVKISLMRFLPHMVIDSVVEYDEHGQSTLPIRFEESQRLQLEGDFNKYFRVYAPRRYEISILSILAPDIMEFLIRKKIFCDIEIVKNHIYFYWPSTVIKRDSFEKYIGLAQDLIEELGDKLVRSDIFADRYQKDAHLTVTKSAKPVTLNKQKLFLPGKWLSTFYASILTCYMWRDYLATKSIFGYRLDEPQRYESLYLKILIVGAVLWVMWYGYRISKSLGLEERIEKRYQNAIDDLPKLQEKLRKDHDQIIKDFVKADTKIYSELDKAINSVDDILIKGQEEEQKIYKEADELLNRKREK